MNHLTRFIIHPSRHRPRQNFFLPRHKRNRKISSSIQFPPRGTPVQNLSLTYLNALHNVEGDTWHRSLKKKEKKKHAGKIELSIQLRHRERGRRGGRGNVRIGDAASRLLAWKYRESMNSITHFIGQSQGLNAGRPTNYTRD